MWRESVALALLRVIREMMKRPHSTQGQRRRADEADAEDEDREWMWRWQWQPHIVSKSNRASVNSVTILLECIA
jgi:hypothetical protein